MGIQEPTEGGVCALSKFAGKKLGVRTGERKPFEFQATPRVEEVADEPAPYTNTKPAPNAPRKLPEARGVWAKVVDIHYKRGFAFLKAEGVSIFLSLSLFPEYQTGANLPIKYGDLVDCEIESQRKGVSVKEIFAIERKNPGRR